jgi:hypothetical protein
MPGKVEIESSVYAFFIPISRVAPSFEELRLRTLLLFYDETNESSPDEAEISYVPLRVMDLINKTELRSLFTNSVEWFNDYPTVASHNLKRVANALIPLRSKLQKNARKEGLALGIPEPTLVTCISYLTTDDVVNYVSGACSLVLLSCLANMGNRSLSE